MREGALFGTMFGLGAGAVIVGVTVSRLVVGQAPEQPAEEPPPAAAEAPPPAIVAPPPAAVVSPATEPPAVASSAAPPIVVLSPAEPPAEAIQRQRRTVVRKHRRAPTPEQSPLATASVPTGTLRSTSVVFFCHDAIVLRQRLCCHNYGHLHNTTSLSK